MLKILKELLLKIVDDIDAGNTDLTEDQTTELVGFINNLTYKEERLSKYSACKYLNISRATFDNYVREGKLPRGNHIAGFKELSWSKKDLEDFSKKMRK